MRIDPTGDVHLPESVLAESGLRPGTDVEFVVEGNTVRIVPTNIVSESRRSATAIQALRGRATAAVTTDSIMALTRGE